jgi:hypothetical protein
MEPSDLIGVFDASLCKPSGLLITEFHDGGAKVYHDTYRCRHCTRHWIHTKETAQRRGFCSRCAGPVCGNDDCAGLCLPYEARLENVEAGRPELTPLPARIVVPDGWYGE